MTEKTSIKEFFKEKTIFLTGGSGFVGKALLEKLLRSCPNIGNIYVLLRPKKGKSIQERLDQITSDPLFEKLKKKYPDNLKKIVPKKGNAVEIGLGLSEKDRQLLIEEVDIFFNMAASVKFDDFLQDAVFINVRSAREAALLALEMKKIKIFLHVSTTFCNLHKKVIEEKLYPSFGNWKDVIYTAETCDRQIFNVFSQKYIGIFPNTYTYTKQLAEHCVNELLVGKVPTVICRPSVVVSTLSDPFQGWIDNFNGPVGLLLAGGSGLLRTVHGDPKLDTDYTAVDNVVKIIIICSWYKAVFGDNNTLDVYHAGKYKTMSFVNSTYVELGKKLYWDVPFEKKIWFPGNSMTKCWYNYFLNVILFHMIPGFILDLILKLAGYPPMITKIQRKIYIANMAIAPFMLYKWEFVNTKTMRLFDFIPPKEVEEFNFKIIPADQQSLYEYYRMSCDYSRRNLLKENKDISQETRTRTIRMYYLDRTIKSIFFGLAIWIIIFKLDIIGTVVNAVCNYWDNL